MNNEKFFRYVDRIINDRTIGNEADKVSKIAAVIEYEKSEEPTEENE